MNGTIYIGRNGDRGDWYFTGEKLGAILSGNIQPKENRKLKKEGKYRFSKTRLK